MNMKKFITAGAGSGKTYTVTTEVANKVKSEGLKPEQVIMTTFTKAAAQELREKAKKELINLDLYAEAQQMEHALIGTVHSVANAFLTKYWYLLGIMPDASAMEEDEMQSFRDESLRGLLVGKDRDFIYQYCEKYNITYSYNAHKTGLNYEFWKEDLCKVLDFMQWYNIPDEQLQSCLEETTESFIKLLEVEKTKSLSDYLTDQFYAEVKAFFALSQRPTNKQKEHKAYYDSLKKETEVTKEIYKEFHEKLKLEITSAGIRYRLTGPATTALDNYITSCILLGPSRAADHRQYAEIIFRLAQQWRLLYRKFKDEHHLIDFNDMESMFLQLLGMEEVQQDIRSRYKCLYVDEFQDSNPMQVSIFQQLSTLIDACYVGDKKQAIYGFRGSDTELTTAVADSIANRTPLPHSYRSVEPLVNLSNQVFSRIFAGMKDVTLTMPADPHAGNRTVVDRPLRLWQWDKDEDLARQIQQFILREEVDCKDIAVLARSNDDLDKLADALRKRGVPVCRENDNIKDSRTGRLIKALLTLMTTPGNLLAKAEIAYLTEPGYHLTRIIEERLDNISSTEQENKDYLKDLPIIARLDALRQYIKSESVSALLETLIIELDLYSLVQRWDNARAEETNLQVFIDLAQKFEASATKLGRPATVAGFIEYFCNQRQKGAADNGGVRLYTYHRSKGLEWKVVIMMSLDEDVEDPGKIAKRCVLGCHNHRAVPPTPDNLNPPMSISLVRNIYTSSGNSPLPPLILLQLQKHPLWDSICQAQRSEQARLLYVGVTRARNILVLAAKGKDRAINLDWFRTTGLTSVSPTLTGEASQDVLGVGIPFVVEALDTDHLLPWPAPEGSKVIDIASAYSQLDSPRNLSPSKAGDEAHPLGKILNDTEQRIPESVPNNREAYARLGDYIHQVFCCMDDAPSLERITALRNDYGFTAKNMPQPELLVDAWHYLIAALQEEYGPSVRRIHEMPFRHVDSNGRHVSGYIDFIWETADAYIIVDYKTCASSYNLIFQPDSEHYAGKHGNQLDCYQRALQAAGSKPVQARLIYYPVTRFLVEVK